jgi:hypothetical protein
LLMVSWNGATGCNTRGITPTQQSLEEYSDSRFRTSGSVHAWDEEISCFHTCASIGRLSNKYRHIVDMSSPSTAVLRDHNGFITGQGSKPTKIVPDQILTASNVYDHDTGVIKHGPRNIHARCSPSRDYSSNSRATRMFVHAIYRLRDQMSLSSRSRVRVAWYRQGRLMLS